ncbi:MAG: HEAT repeat domain-containing protein [Vicinamibacteria bacterium]
MKLQLSTLFLSLTLGAPAAHAADTLGTQIAAAQRSGKASWVAWSVPSAADGVVCCWNGRESRGAQSCSLSSNNYGMNMGNSSDGIPQIDDTLMVYAHVDAAGVDKVRVFSNSCRIDRGGETVLDVANVTPADSVRYLETLIPGAGESDVDGTTKRRSDGALMAIALHDDKSADPVLERTAKSGDTKSLRHSATFWLGNTRERPGYEALVRLRASDDASLREQLAFAFTQSKVPEAQVTLIDMARNDPSAKVRGQALFWIAQRAQKKSDADVVRGAVDNDPDLDVKKKAVFALSQIPNGEGVTELIRVARENKTPEVRKQAMFWLGQSKDPRALAFFEKVLAQ